jgi:hypothetical protein
MDIRKEPELISKFYILKIIMLMSSYIIIKEILKNYGFGFKISSEVTSP